MPPSIVEEERGDQRCPAGLMAGADAGAVVPVEVFMKGNAIPPMRIGLKVVVVAPHGAAAPAGGGAQEEVCEGGCQVRGGLAEIAQPSGAGRAFHLQGVSVVEVVIVQCTNEKVVHRKPDRSAPVRVAAKKTVVRLAGHVLDAKLLAVDVEDIRVLQVIA